MSNIIQELVDMGDSADADTLCAILMSTDPFKLPDGLVDEVMEYVGEPIPRYQHNYLPKPPPEAA